MAAYGELSLRSCLTTMPPVDLAIVSAPVKSVMVMIVLLNDAKMCAIPHFLSAMIYITLRCSLSFRNRQLVVAATPHLSLIHISEPTRLGMISYAVFCLKKKKKKK